MRDSDEVISKLPFPSELGRALISFVIHDNGKLSLGVLPEWKRNKWGQKLQSNLNTESDTQAMPREVPGHFLTRTETIKPTWNSPKATQQLPTEYLSYHATE